MNPLVSSSQAYFFRHHGYIEFESILSLEECDEVLAHIDAALFSRCKRAKSRVPCSELYANGRDLWRVKDFLKTRLLSKRFTSPSFGLTNKPSLYLAFDQWMPSMQWQGSIKTKDLFSIQGLASVYFVRLSEPKEGEIHASTFQMEPGLIPLPSKKGSILVIQPHLLLNLPRLESFSTDLYCVGYALPNAVYFHNEKDPCNHELKAHGYHFGDRLNPSAHPLIRS